MARRGEYFDAAVKPLGKIGRWGDWFTCVMLVAMIMASVGWLITMWPVMWLWPSPVSNDDGGQFTLIYLASVAIVVIPAAIAVGYQIDCDQRHLARTLKVLPLRRVWFPSELARATGLTPFAAYRVLDYLHAADRAFCENTSRDYPDNRSYTPLL